MEARFDDQQALVERDERMAEAAAETDEHVLAYRELSLDFAPDATAEDLEAADDLLAASLDGCARRFVERRAYLQGDACPFPGPVWSWFLSPHPQPGRLV